MPGLETSNLQGLEPSLRPASEFRNLQPSFPLNEPGQDYNIQLIIAKLDLINSRLQNIEQKVAAIEQIAKQSQEQEKWTPRKLY
ncbi:hypothetical protein HYX18_00610 [Candidatus Woesearchaeota archaeon]|nr:hypothetical protein [Candidatus Woesearchaeota archaeon]